MKMKYQLTRRPRPRHKPGEMNQMETRYANQILEPKKMAGEIRDYKYEKIKLKLAPKTFYTPDFFVITPQVMEVHEVKGYMEDDAAVKIKVAAEMFPEFIFYLVTWKNKREGWVIKQI